MNTTVMTHVSLQKLNDRLREVVEENRLVPDVARRVQQLGVVVEVRRVEDMKRPRQVVANRLQQRVCEDGGHEEAVLIVVFRGRRLLKPVGVEQVRLLVFLLVDQNHVLRVLHQLDEGIGILRSINPRKPTSSGFQSLNACSIDGCNVHGSSWNSL